MAELVNTVPGADKPEAQFLADVLGDPTRPIEPAELVKLLAVARSKKPSGLDVTSIDAQKRYRGHARGALEALLLERFPTTQAGKTKIKARALNFLKTIARMDAGVYTSEPDRWLERDNNERVAPDDPAAKIFAGALKDSGFQRKMTEAERRALITPGTVPIEVVWHRPPEDKIGYAHLRMLWAHDFNTICHAQAPTEWAFKRCVIIRQPKPYSDAAGEFYRVYVRKAPDDIEGGWGPWFLSLRSTESLQFTTTPVPIKGKLLPVFLVQLGEPEGSVFTYEDSDLIDDVDDLNIRRSDESFVLGLQGHGQLWTNDTTKEDSPIKIGADGIIVVNGQLGIINYNAPIEQAQRSREVSLKELAVSRGSSPHAYESQNTTIPQSGVAMRIDNQKRDQRVQEQGGVMQDLEEDDALPIMKDVIMANRPDAKVLEPLSPRMMPMKVRTIEDPSQKQQRLERAADRKWITNQRAATDAELYSTVEEATTAMKAIEEEAKANPPPTPTPPGPPAPPIPPTPPQNPIGGNGGSKDPAKPAGGSGGN